VINKRDTCECVCNLYAFNDQCDRELHFEGSKWWFSFMYFTLTEDSFGLLNLFISFCYLNIKFIQNNYELLLFGIYVL